MKVRLSVLLLFLVLFVQPIFAQVGNGNYQVTINTTVWDGHDNNSGRCSNNFKYYFQYTDNANAELVWQEANGLGTQPTVWSKQVTFPATRALVKIYTTSSRNWHSWGGCNGYDDNKGPDKYMTIPCFVGSYNDIYDVWSSYTSISIAPEKVVIAAPSNILPENDKLSFQASHNFPSSVYNWQYSLDGNTWNDFPSGSNSDNISISGYELMGSAFRPLIGSGNIFIRIDYKCGKRYSNILTLNPRLSSPKIVSTIATPNKCYGESNGNVKIQFDRALLPNESLNIYLEDTTSTSGYSNDMLNLTSLNADNSVAWPSELPPGGYRITLLGKYPNSSITTYTDGINHIGRFGFTGPTAVQYSATSRDVYCNGGSDATITVNATGGVGNYQVGYKKMQDNNYTWMPFSSANQHVITGLDTGTYYIRLLDGNNCIMKDGSGNEVISTIAINQPAEALHVDASQIINPLAFGYTDGSITAILTGGTPISGNSYNVDWSKLDGTSFTPQAPTTNPFTTVVQNLGDGKYILSAKDANFTLTSGVDAKGCMLKDTFTVTQPLPLKVTINEKQVISCKGANDGLLYAQGEGGIEIPIFRYKYQWFKNDNGSWMDISQSDSIATRLIAGIYKVIITDKNNITKESTPFTLTEPEQLVVSLTSTPLICNGSNNGTADASITGGTLPYHIEWATGDTTNAITGLSQGTYMAFITDARGCQTQQQVKVASPDPILFSNIIVKDPTCFGGKDGAITYVATGGAQPYTYSWSNNATSPMLNAIPAGNYNVTITDKNNCTAQQTFKVFDPAKVVVDLGPDRTLCNEQVLIADASIANGMIYQWSGSSGFSASTSQVTLSNPGTYNVKAIDGNGCTAFDTINITRSNALVAAEMVAATQAFQDQDVELVNISKPAPEKVEWLLPPDNVTVLNTSDQYAAIRFRDTGLYTIGLKTMVGACEKIVTQPITIVKAESFDDPGGTASPFVKEFVVLPNPSHGQFTVKITLQEASPIELRLININSGLIANVLKQSGSAQYIIPYNLNLAAGIYSLVLETSKEYRVIKIMIL
ncbi:T9SS type A sorting domain-containing protein [Pinibacter aurantiacus]|uniref:T9SS type A sorting domain-containing protein n=1 Tax=Pinibacter aurantiacus TaxID=2851599 RepID=A0A9E2SB26_9BACT|nr:T9SS type A sorting domain-containing protein [Pinibacter aurantiacus]MBV4357200.1 hypothetical protein [Pinibacter aurantiacus]